MDLNIDSEFGKLKSVFLHIPIEENFRIHSKDLKQCGYSSIPDFKKIIDEIWKYIEKLESLGITVYTDEKYDKLKYEYIKKYNKIFPNLIYFRDLVGIFDSNIVVANPLFESRQGEQLYAAELFKEMFNINCIFVDKNSFEPTDTMFVDKNKLVINVGYRTDYAAVNYFKEKFNNKYKIMTARCNSLRAVPQHIQGSKNVFDKDTIAVRHQLHNFTFNFNNKIYLDETKEIKNNFAFNVFNLAPKEIIMPDNCPKTQKIFEDNGIICHTAQMKYLTAGDGGFTCITLPLKREKIWN